MEKFDVVVVGAGLAGTAAAYTAAKAGAQVLMVERGTAAGTKSVSGGLLYTHVLSQMFPQFWDEQPCPVERAIDRNVLSFLTPTQATSIEHFDPSFSQPPYNSWSVLRSRLDSWLAAKAEGAGALPIYGVRVDELVREKGRIVGIRQEGDEIRADVVIQAEGVNSTTSQAAGLVPEVKARCVGIGVKQVIGLPPGEVERRFQLRGTAGTQYTTVGFPSGVVGGGFVYTNRDSLSVGLILELESVATTKTPMYEVLESFKQHPFVERLIQGGSLLEYSACYIGEGGETARPTPSGDGYLLAGSAAGLFLNTGFTLRGMDFALESGRLAGEVAAEAVRQKNSSAGFLSRYQNALAQSFALRELQRFPRYPEFFERSRGLYRAYPKILNQLLHQAYSVDSSGGRPRLPQMLHGVLRDPELRPLDALQDLWRAMRTL
jgi:electron transfer flavoprotein-quinone oxidoreductase